MKAAEIREMSTDEILKQIDETREELMNLRFQQATGELVDFTRLRYTRRLVARLQTIINEREREMQKTAVVEVTRTYRHRLYKKVVSSHNRHMAHDELDCQIGDQVVIVESKPLSKNKVVEKILSSDIRAQEPLVVEEVEE